MILNKDNYFSKEADTEYVSVSQIKSFQECEFKALAKINREYKDINKKALLLGSYFHSWCESEEAFKEYNENNKNTIVSAKTKKKYSDYVLVDNIIESLEVNQDKHKRLFQLIRNNNVNHEVIITSELFGINFKIMIDLYSPELGFIADMKLMKNDIISDKFWNNEKRIYENFIKYYKYDIQMIVYSEIERLSNNRTEILKPMLCVVTKEIPTTSTIFYGFDDKEYEEYRREVLDDLKLYLQRIDGIKKGRITPFMCGKCDWCKINTGTEMIHFDFSV